MESRLRFLFLSVTVLVMPALSGCAALPFFGPGEDTQAAEAPEQVIEPEVERREIVQPRIDTEDFEIGVYAGGMSVEDFGVNAVYGATIAYHLNEALFVEGAIGRTDTEETSFELLSGAAQILDDAEREFTYYNASIGWAVRGLAATTSSRSTSALATACCSTMSSRSVSTFATTPLIPICSVRARRHTT